MRFRVPFKKFKTGMHPDYLSTRCLFWPCLTVGWLYVRFSWELVVHITYALPPMITPEAMEDAINLYGDK